MTGLYNNTWKKSFIIYFKKAKVMGGLSFCALHKSLMRTRVWGCMCVWCVCVVKEVLSPYYSLPDFLIILGILHWKNKKKKNTHFHNIQMEYHWNLSFKFASCLLFGFDAVHLPFNELFFSSQGDWAQSARGVGAGRAAGRRSRDLYCVCIYLSLSRTGI